MIGGVGVGFITWSMAKRPRLLDMVLERRPPAVMLSFGDIRPHAQKIKRAEALLICQVQTLEQAKYAASHNADILVAQGAEAAGHGISRGTFAFVPAVVDAAASPRPSATPPAAATGMSGGCPHAGRRRRVNGNPFLRVKRGCEAAMHATGRYPAWWKGRRFERPVVGWVCGITGEVVRDTVQRVLVGRPGQGGTGAIPKDALRDCVSARGTPDLLDTIKVEHVSGGQSLIGLKTYASGREKFQGEILDFVWFDEEPPIESTWRD
jgi:hypothetical protein